MKLKHALSMVLLAVTSLLGFSGRREEIANEASTAKTHANGIIPLTAEVTMGTRYLLVQKGSAADGMIVNIATTRPLGVCMDEPTSGNKAAVGLLGCMPGTIKMRSAVAITAGQLVYTAAAGKVSPTYGATLFLMGRAVTGCAGTAGDDIIEVAHCFPMINAVNTL